MLRCIITKKVSMFVSRPARVEELSQEGNYFCHSRCSCQVLQSLSTRCSSPRVPMSRWKFHSDKALFVSVPDRALRARSSLPAAHVHTKWVAGKCGGAEGKAFNSEPVSPCNGARIGVRQPSTVLPCCVFAFERRPLQRRALAGGSHNLIPLDNLLTCGRLNISGALMTLPGTHSN